MLDQSIQFGFYVLVFLQLFDFDDSAVFKTLGDFSNGVLVLFALIRSELLLELGILFTVLDNRPILLFQVV